MSSSYLHEAEIAQLAVQRAAILTKQVFLEKLKGTISKDDASPVTIGDFGAQALIIHALRHNFPDDQIVGEEEADSLRTNSELCEQIWQRVRTTHLTDTSAEISLGGSIPSVSAMLDTIDEGNSSGGSRGRIWALDPIDGTKGFLRGGQYAVCLALMVDGEVKVGVLGCPNLPVDDSIPVTVESGYNQTSAEGNGVLIAAVAGQGATSRPLGTASLEPSKTIRMRPVPDIKLATFCESVETGHSSHGHHHEIATKLGVTNPSVRMDSQAKYACLARGAADIYLRLSVRADYQEKIWDHAPGYLIVTESGGTVTDFMGRKLDFSLGRTLAGNKGIVATSHAIHSNVLNVVQSVLTSKI